MLDVVLIREGVPRTTEPKWVPTIIDVAGKAAAYGARQGRERLIRVPTVADFSWHAGSRCLTATPHAHAEPDWVTDAIQTIATPLFMQAELSFEVLHASAVATDLGVVGLCGASGHGKSTLAHGLAQRGASLWADDLLAVRAESSGFVATALPFVQNLRAASRDFFQSVMATKSLPGRATAWSRRRLRALFVLAPMAGSRSPQPVLDITPLRAADAMASLLTHGMRLLPLDKARERRILTAYVDLVASVPVFRLTYAQDFAHLPALLDSLEHEARESTLLAI